MPLDQQARVKALKVPESRVSNLTFYLATRAVIL